MRRKPRTHFCKVQIIYGYIRMIIITYYQRKIKTTVIYNLVAHKNAYIRDIKEGQVALKEVYRERNSSD